MKLGKSTWSPWFSGMFLSLLFFLYLYLINMPVETLNSYLKLSYYMKDLILYGEFPERIDWQIYFFFGLFIGAIIAAISGNDFKLQLFPEDHMSKGPVYYIIVGPVLMFVGGFLVMSGLIIAGGAFFQLLCDSMALCIVVMLFLLIMFVEAVVIGTISTLKIEEKK